MTRNKILSARISPQPITEDLFSFHCFLEDSLTYFNIYLSTDFETIFGKIDQTNYIPNVYFKISKNQLTRLAQNFSEDEQMRYAELLSEYRKNRRNAYYRHYNKVNIKNRKAYNRKWYMKNTDRMREYAKKYYHNYYHTVIKKKGKQ